MNKKTLPRIMLLLIAMVATASAVSTVDPIAAFGTTFVGIYSANMAKIIVLGVALFSAYEFYKTKQFTFLIIGAIIAIIVVGAPNIAQQGSAIWKTNFDDAVAGTGTTPVF